MGIDELLNPHSAVVIGSAAPGKLANVLLHRLSSGGMSKLFAVNPKGQGVDRIAGYRSVQEIGEKVDLAVIAAPAATVPGVMEDCGKAGVRSAVIISSGFSEVGNAAGEDAVKRVAAQYGIRFVGPNCAGVVNTHAGLVATIETAPSRGNISIISQSGAVGGAFMAMSAERHLGISKFLSFGNGGDLTVTDFLEYLKTDPDTNVIAMYLESVRDGRALMHTLKDVTREKPVILIKAGRTSTGQRAALSHTGSMAGSDAVFDAALRQCGVIRAETLQSLFDLCEGFSMLPPVKGRRLLVVTNSGGPGVMSTDRAEQQKIEVPEPDEALMGELTDVLKANAAVKNPIDLTVEGTGEQYRQVLVTALTAYDSALALYIGTPYLKAMPVAEGIARAAKESGKPIAAVMMVGSDIKESRMYLNQESVPAFSQGEVAVDVFEKMAEYAAYREKDSHLTKPAQPVDQTLSGHLLEPQAMALLQGSGLPVPPHSFVTRKSDIAKACEELGFPLVMKVVSPQIVHKSDVGGVILPIRSRSEAETAFDRLAKVAEGKDFRGAMLYPLLSNGTEVILGFTRDPQFGPVVAFGLGGIYTEVFKDVVLRVAPVDVEEAHKMIESTRSFRILQGIRGQNGADLDALASMISTFSQLPFRYPKMKEADLNPVIVRPSGAVVADVRILCREN